MNVPDILAQAVRLHQAGALGEAERLYQQILAIQPDHADSLHLLGVISYQAGRLDEAVARIGKAIAVRPDFPEAYSNLGNVLKNLGRLDDAVDSFRKALALKPDYAEAYSNLANALWEHRRLDEAVAASRKAIELDPRFPQAHANLGNALMAQGKPAEAVAAYAQALALHPNYPEVLGNLGNAYALQGNLADAIVAYRKALELRPDYPEAHVDLGNALRSQGRLDEAVASYRSALEWRPAYPEALSNLSAVLWDLGRYDEAMASCRKALALRPDYPEAWSNLGNALLERGQRAGAIECYTRAVALKPDYPEAHNNLAKALQEQGRLDEAIASFRRALALRPDLAEIHNNLGSTLTDLGRLDEAIACYRAALALRPGIQQAYSNLLMSLHYAERQFEEEHARTVRGYADLMARTSTSAVIPRPKAEGPLGPQERSLPSASLRAGAALGMTEVRDPVRFPNAPDPDRRLRIGYVSADLRSHPVGHFLSCLLPAHDPAAVEVFCYSNSALADGVTAGLQRAAHHWRPIAGRPDAEVDAMIRQDGIDILVDLAGHTAKNRLAIFAARAAPVQATWLGYFGTTGLATMDYILADRFVVPPGEEPSFSETVWRLPDSYFCFAAPDLEVPIVARPAGEELVLGSFNTWSKVSDGTVGLWSRVLSAIPGSRLLLKTRFLDNPEVRRDAFARFARHGIAAERLILEGPVPRAELLAAYNRMDIALDPFPFGGGATTLEALWMGVPVVAQRGDRWVARVAESILATAGLPDLVAADADGYVRLVERLAADRARRDELRRSLRAMLTRSPLCDGPRFARAIEDAFRTMWKTWCRSRSSEPDAVLKSALGHHQAGRLAEAERLYREVLAIDPGHADALHFLGMIAHQTGRNDMSAELIGRAIGIDPAAPLYRRNLGVSLFLLGRFDEALAAYDAAVSLEPAYAEAHHNRGETLQALGRLDQAMAAYTTAVGINPGHVSAHLALGNALRRAGRLEEAIAAYERAIQAQPDYAEAHSNRGACLNDLGRREEAVAAYDEAIRFKPDYAEAHSNRGNALRDLGRLEEALGSYDQALRIKPDHAGFHSNRGAALNALGLLEEAVAAYDQAIRLRPDHAEAHKNRGVALNDLGRNAEAIAAYDEAIRLRPDDAEAHSNRLLALHYGETADPSSFLASARRYAAQFDRPPQEWPFAATPDPGRRLRIGYVSGDFRRHPVGFLLVQILENHDPSAVEVFCYSSNRRDDDVTARFRQSVGQSAGHWRSLVGLSDEEAADRVRADRIDILVDLAGHTPGNRLPLFALRAAPVQATWLGYFGTTGLAAMDYVLADRFVVPAGEEAFFTERICRLPDSYLCLSVPEIDVPVAEPWEGGGRPVTFGSFNNLSKTSPATVDLWARVLSRVPGSRLLLKTRALGDEAARRRLRESFAAHGIAPERLMLERNVARAQLLAAYRRLDVALDPTPYGGGVTTLEALWMGVPVVSLRGNTWVGRLGESILTTMGLPELVAGSAAGYVDIAARLAMQGVRPAAARTGLRLRAEASPSFQAGRFARGLEAAYRSLWRDWCLNGARTPVLSEIEGSRSAS